jgi:enoyl-CoA hydratase/carnithine racemase
MTPTGVFTRIETTESEGVAVLTLASDKVNALDVETLGEITAYVEACGSDDSVRALVVTGQGSIFSAGLNVGEVVDNDIDRTGVLLDALNTALIRLFAFPKPTVAAINGPAIAGGCIVACACDKRLIVDGARIGATELKVGVSFPVFAVELLLHACGADAEQLMLDAALVDAEEACRRGLAHRVVGAEDLATEAVALAGTLARLDPRAYALAKATTRRHALAVADDEACREIDRQVLAQWQDDTTRASLDRLRKPKG